MAGVDFDFSDVDDFFADGKKEIHDIVDKVGTESDEYDKKDGTYQNHTYTLRNSNNHEADADCNLILYNDAKSPKGYNYASNVESKGYEVQSGAALFAEKRLREEIE